MLDLSLLTQYDSFKRLFTCMTTFSTFVQTSQHKYTLKFNTEFTSCKDIQYPSEEL